MLRPGTYRDREGRLVRVERTETGYLIHRADGSTEAIGAAR